VIGTGPDLAFTSTAKFFGAKFFNRAKAGVLKKAKETNNKIVE
jgi:hypothetical protein